MTSIVLPYFSTTRYAGAVDHIDEGMGIRGWLVEPEAAGEPLWIEAQCQGVRLATSVAVLDRPDIDAVLGRTTQCGFLLGWSCFDTAALARAVAADRTATLSFVIHGTESEVPVVRDPILAVEVLAMARAAPRGDRQSIFAYLNDYIDLSEAGLFDADWYRAVHPPADPGVPPLLRAWPAGSGRAPGRRSAG